MLLAGHESGELTSTKVIEAKEHQKLSFRRFFIFRKSDMSRKDRHGGLPHRLQAVRRRVRAEKSGRVLLVLWADVAGDIRAEVAVVVLAFV